MRSYARAPTAGPALLRLIPLLHHPFSPLSGREGAGNKRGGKQRKGASTDSLASATSFLRIPGFVTLLQGQRAQTRITPSPEIKGKEGGKVSHRSARQWSRRHLDYAATNVSQWGGREYDLKFIFILALYWWQMHGRWVFFSFSQHDKILPRPLDMVLNPCQDIKCYCRECAAWRQVWCFCTTTLKLSGEQHLLQGLLLAVGNWCPHPSHVLRWANTYSVPEPKSFKEALKRNNKHHPAHTPTLATFPRISKSSKSRHRSILWFILQLCHLWLLTHSAARGIIKPRLQLRWHLHHLILWCGIIFYLSTGQTRPHGPLNSNLPRTCALTPGSDQPTPHAMLI